LITHLCLLIISDSVAVEIFAIGQPCVKIFSKVWCATFFLRHGVLALVCVTWSESEQERAGAEVTSDDQFCDM